MVTSTHNQPLLNPSNPKSKTTQKILNVFLTFATFISLTYLALLIIQPYQSNPINHLPFCDKSHDTTACESFIQSLTSSHKSTSTRSLLRKILISHVVDINKAIHASRTINHLAGQQAVADCLQLLDLSQDRVLDSIRSLSVHKSDSNQAYVDDDDRNSWLSAVLTNHVTCMDQLQDHKHLIGFKSKVEGLISRASSLLAIHAEVTSTDHSHGWLKTRWYKGSYPGWVGRKDRKLLGLSGSEIEADVVVAKDGSGNFTTVAEAVASAPDKGKSRYVIYVKEGVYEENVEVGKKKKNVMMVGDGMNLSVITGSENVVDGNTTFRSATLAAVGDGFILQDICIQNTAGPEKHQAVALRVGADQSVINRCKIDAYQDTLYAHSLRQFYTDSVITGTVDFIFGNAQVVFQNSQLIARLPMASQKNMVTAQGRTDPNQVTGTSIQYCDIIPSEDLAPVTDQFPTFLGRPWKNFSRTVYMQSEIGDHIVPKGWAEWDGDFALDTLYYAEYMNTGPGANTSQRVNWTGYHVITDPLEAKQFTVSDFIQGQEWLDSAGVTYVEGL